jgi:flagellar basal-body rod protein FlgB
VAFGRRSEGQRMSSIQAPLFQMMSARLSWLGERQVTLSQNMANADTPDYRPRDLREAAFTRLMRTVQNPASRIGLAQTDPGHQGGGPKTGLDLTGHPAEHPYETTPDGNAVILEEQMAKATATALDYQLTSNLYRKYLGMIRIALGNQP